MTSDAARFRRAIESFHAVCYFASEVREPYVDAGLHPWASYFGQRAAPMGAVGAATVSATFFNFNPRLVDLSVPSVWETIPPKRAVEMRFEGVARAIHRLVPELPGSAALAAAGDIARRGVGACEFAGRPLSSAHAAVDPPDDALSSLWWALTILREHRGDGHVAALVVDGLGPVEALVTSPGFGDMPPDYYRRNRKWDDETWQLGVDTSRSRGWIDEDGGLTEAGRALREQIERRTDDSMRRPIEAMGRDLGRLVDVVAPISAAIREAGATR